MANPDSDRTAESSPSTWAQVFPWTPRCREAERFVWLLQDVNVTPVDERPEIIATIAELAAEHSDTPIGTLFPAAVGYPLDQLELPTRLRNVVRRSQATTGVALWSMTVRDLHDLRSVGPQTVHTLMRELAWVSIGPQDGSPVARTVDATPFDDLHALAHLKVTLGFGAQLVLPTLTRNELSRLGTATADRLLSMTWETVNEVTVCDCTPNDTPAMMVNANGSAESVRAADLTAEPGAAGWSDVAGILADAIDGFGGRGWAIFEGRCVGEAHVTLDDLGVQFGVTRERIRQVEAKLLSALRELIADDGPFADLVDELRSALDAPLTVGTLRRMVPALADTVGTRDVNVLGALAAIDVNIFVDAGWAANRPLDGLRETTTEAIDGCLGDHGAARLQDVRDSVDGALGASVDEFEAWAQACGFRIANGWVTRSSGSKVEQAVAALHIAGQPMSLEQIVAAMGDVSEKSLSQRLADAPQVMRTDVSSWGLAEWDVLEYKSIRGNIRDLLDQHGGRMAISEIEEFMCSHFSVSRNSVHQYATSHPFVAVDGFCTVGPTPQTPRLPARAAPRVFRQGTRWAYRIRVTSEHVRGSGFPVPTYLAVKLGLRPGERVTLRTQQGTHTFSWVGLQPQSSSIRGHLVELDAVPGDDVFLLCADDGQFSVVQATIAGEAPLQRALSLIGARPDTPPSMALQLLADAGEFESGSISELAAAYADRGDDDIAGALREAARATSPV